jgi:hypothetical protein
MEAIEFVSKIENRTIKIPRHVEDLDKEVRVIILIDQDIIKKKPTKKKRFSALKIDTKNLKFDRDEANRR